MNQQNDLERVMEQYGNSLYRMSYYMLQNEQDAQDILQETFIRYLQRRPKFETAEHEKAWLLRVTNNLCKDMLRFRSRNRYLNLNDLENMESQLIRQNVCTEDSMTEKLILYVFGLKSKYKTVIYLHYYEGYQLKEIADILGISESAVKKRLQRGRDFLRKYLEEK